jgi:hypothetical protein
MTRITRLLLLAAPLLLASCSDDASSGGTADPSLSAGTTDGTTTAAAQQWTLLSDSPDGEALAEGAYGLTANGVSNHVAVVRAPAGYQNLGGWTFVTDQPFHAMGFVTAIRVPRDPCGVKGQDKYDTAEIVGRSVKDLATALVAQKGAVTSRPVPVTIDGHRGLYLTYRVADSIDVTSCAAHAFDIFSTGPGTWWLEASRERAAIWILDVDGDRVVLAWVAVPGVPRAELREMTRMVRSAQFVKSGS